jgi:aspartokinase
LAILQVKYKLLDMKVLKFGGTSVANADIKLVLRIINEAKEMKN